jgi:hypothetical protein
MKKKLIFAGMLALAPVFGLIVCGCPTDGGGNLPVTFEGTWINSGEFEDYKWELIYKFTGNQFEYSDNFGGSRSGTFTFTDTEITFTPNYGDPWKQSYSLSEDTLTIASDDQYPFGDFLKQN